MWIFCNFIFPAQPAAGYKPPWKSSRAHLYISHNFRENRGKTSNFLYFQQFLWKNVKKMSIFVHIIFSSATCICPIFGPDFEQKLLKTAYFGEFCPKIWKKSAIFCTFIFSSNWSSKQIKVSYNLPKLKLCNVPFFEVFQYKMYCKHWKNVNFCAEIFQPLLKIFLPNWAILSENGLVYMSHFQAIFLWKTLNSLYFQRFFLKFLKKMLIFVQFYF